MRTLVESEHVAVHTPPEVIPPTPTAGSPPTSATAAGPWPPDVDLSDLPASTI